LFPSGPAPRPNQALACIRLTSPHQEARYPEDAEKHFEEVPQNLEAPQYHGYPWQKPAFSELECVIFFGVLSRFETKPIWSRWHMLVLIGMEGTGCLVLTLV
jgi:hypothetical protein